MKKIKNYVLFSIIAICSFALMGMIKVEAADAMANNFNIVCDPDSIEHGDTSNCYVIAQVTVDTATGAGLYAVNAYNVTTKHLTINDFKSSLTGVTVEKSLSYGQTSSVNTNFKCNATSGKCYTVFSSSDTGAIKASSTTTGISVIDNSTNYKGYTPIGYFVVALDETATKENCGEICVALQYAVKISEINTTSSGLTNTGLANGCAEITPTSTGGGDNPETGNFASYAALAAGALIAISAIVVAKKHNKFYRV